MKVPNLKSCFLRWFSAMIVLAVFGQITFAVTQEWVATYNIGGGTSDYSEDIAVDSAGNIYVTGYSGSDGWCVTTVKYNSAGVQQWVRNYNYNPGSNFGDIGNAIAVDASGNVYVTGYTDNGLNNEDILTLKYLTDGTFQWAATYNGGANGYDEGHDIAVNSLTGDVYVTGRSGGNLIMIRYSSAGAQLFTRTYGGGGGYGIALSGSGHVYATGTNGAQYMTIKCTADLATELWYQYYGSGTAWDIAVDSSGDAYVTGNSSGTCTTVKYDNAFGTQLWARSYLGVSSSGEAIVVDSSGNAYVAGSANNGSNDDYLTIMYNTTGVQQWANTYDGDNDDDKAHGIAIDTNSPPNVYVTGESDHSMSQWDFATIMYDNSGTQQWVMRYNGTGNSFDHGQAIAVYDKDNIYVTGEATNYSYDFATVKYSQATTRIVKWMQPPDLRTHHGIDVNAVNPYILADDFNCTDRGAITEITVWGSWINDQLPFEGDPTAISFTLSIHKDIPADDPQNPDDYSKPGEMLWMKDFGQGDFTAEKQAEYIEEGWMDPGIPEPHYIYQADTVCWKYTFTIDPNEAFIQKGEPNAPIVYWLDVQAQPFDTMANFGWKTSYKHWNDDAVWGTGSEPYTGPWYELTYPVGHPNSPDSIDLAFRIITTGEEPNEPNEPDVKWLQRPDLTTNGVDVFASDPLILADDFNCSETTLITDITIWGSWKDDILPDGDANNVTFTLSLHSDIPASQSSTGYSMPGETLWFMDINPAEVSIEKDNIEEGWYNPETYEYIFPGDTVCWKYVFRIPEADAYCQQGTDTDPIIYWLDVQAHPTGATADATFGWKSSIDHWNDDAVWGNGIEPHPGPWDELIYPDGHELHPNSIDLAFIIDGNIPCSPNEPVSDLGDAPDSTNSSVISPMTAYPGIGANFPTVFVVGSPPFGPIHLQPTLVAWLGNNVTLENEADIGPDQDPTNNIIPASDTSDLDGADDGVPNIPLHLPKCYPQTTIDYQINVVNPNVDLYVNVWCDWDRDGDWDDTADCAGTSAPEWAVQNDMYPAGSLAVGLNTVTSPPLVPWHPTLDPEDMWMRITLSGQPWTDPGYVNSGGCGPAGGYAIGETEDYLFTPDPNCLWVGRIFNNGLTVTANMMNMWNTLGKPICWCCEAQKLGNGAYGGPSASRVDTMDLAALKLSWFRTYTQPGYDPCADYNLSGRVDTVDLAILKTNWFRNVGPCPQ
ncbi:MAG: SBBP repeat-containing protein [Sedimentisphaerales bacterium]|nr:SBBP repeat-containing protein [Sedimentisphaerales bacterium]